MSENQLELEIKDFRAIQEARIALNGITVISGENGCGKSTISKLMYYSVKAINEYEEIAYKPLLFFLKRVNHAFTNIINDFNATILSVDNIIYSENIPDNTFTANKVYYIKDSIKSQARILKNLQTSTLHSLNFNHKQSILRFKMILQQFLEIKTSTIEWDQIIDSLMDLIDHKIDSVHIMAKNREYKLLNSYIIRFFNNETLLEKFNLYEYNVCLTSKDTNKLLNISTVSKVLYIDTPMAVGLQETNIQHWDYLNEVLQKEESSSQSETLNITHFLSDEILNGEASFDTKSILGRFIYHRKDGLVINLLDCATGIKSFAILQMLVKNGYLDNKTLLIIDEPEAHLHPQWIVEYARIITLLNKELGVKFLIASHNPDMISALKYITKKEEVSGNLNFYLAEKAKNDMYIYKGLGTEIDEIFNSFNIAIDRINQYGTLNDEVF